MKVRFVNVAVGATFGCQGKPFFKLALSMAEDANRTGNLFLDDVIVNDVEDGHAADPCPAKGVAA